MRVPVISNYIFSNNIYDRNMKEHVCKFTDETNVIVYDFRYLW